jgi:putative phage-type endonuclease
MNHTPEQIKEIVKSITGRDMEILGVNAEHLDHDEWLRIRTKGMGGSDVANIIGVPGAFGSPLSTYMSKIGEPDDQGFSEVMQWGSVLEEPIRQEYARRTGYPVTLVDATLHTPDAPHRRANTDGFVQIDGEWGILEIKNVGFTAHEWADDRVPPKYYSQVQWYMFITGLKFARVVALVGGQQMIERHVDFDSEFVDAMVEDCETFWNEHVLKNVPPKSTGNPRCADALKKLHPPKDDEPIVELDDHEQLLDLWLEYSQHEKEFKKLKDQTSNKIFELVGKSKKATFKGKSVVSHSITRRKSFDSKKLEKDDPELFAKYSKESESQFFRITYKGSK